MRLVNARITNYRSVEDSDAFDIDPHVTCLVGKNEAGKTAVLRALYLINPVERGDLDEDLDFPAKRSRDRGRRNKTDPLNVVTAHFELTTAEAEAISEELGDKALTDRTFSVTRSYRGSSGGTWTIPTDDAAITAHFLGQLDPTTREFVGTPGSVEDLIAALDGVVEKPDSVTRLLTKLRDWGGEGWRLALHLIKPLLPRFVYYDNYDMMPGKVAIPALATSRDQDTLERGERALLNLLDLAGAELEDFSDTSNHERLVRRIENAGNGISDEVFEYWTQNTDLSVKLQTLQPESGAKPPLDRGTNLQVRVHNSRHGVSVPFDERSRGFVWFFSFLAYFDHLEAQDDGQLILLLDEPGLSLHGRAQADLLRLIEDRLAPEHQVIYTTHSPFMVSPDHLGRVRTVIDRDPGGTTVSSEIFKADEATVAPLHAAMGIEISQNLFVGPHVLLLEGPSDLIYLDVLNKALADAGRKTLDPRWVKVPVGGAGKLSTFVTLLGENKLNVAVLVDSSTAEEGALKRLRDNDQLRPDGLIKIGDITGARNADIEDLFDRAYYLDLVNHAYARQLSAPIDLNDLNAKIPRIVKQVEEHFHNSNVADGHFDHYRPAAVLLQPDSGRGPVSLGTMDLAEKLFTKLNTLLPKA